MPLSRPTKTLGNTTFVAENAAGQPLIRADEVDADFDTLFNYFGNIVNADIAPGAAIDYPKLHLSGQIVDGDVANVSGSKLTGLSVTNNKLQIGSSVTSIAVANAIGNQNAQTTLVDLTEVASITPRGGPVIIFGKISATVRLIGQDTQVAYIYLYINGTIVATYPYRIAVTGTATTVEMPFDISPLYFLATSSPTSYAIKLVGSTSGASCIIHTEPGIPGSLYVVELA